MWNILVLVKTQTFGPPLCDATTDPAAYLYHDPNGAADTTALTAAEQAIQDMVAFNVTLPMQSMVAVRPTSVTAGEILDTVTLTYTVQDSVFAANAIALRLPIGWMPDTVNFTLPDGTSAPNSTFGALVSTDATATDPTNLQWTSVSVSDPLVATDNPESTAHVTVGIRFARRATGSSAPAIAADDVAITTATATGDAEVTLEIDSSATEPMLRGDMITVTFHNVKARELRSLEFDESGMIKDEIVVTDGIPGSMYDVSIMVDPPMQSAVSVSPTSVDQGEIVDITVTYRVQEEMLFGGQ